jgi:hypothetical protein
VCGTGNEGSWDMVLDKTGENSFLYEIEKEK